jgi:hypothetical protein
LMLRAGDVLVMDNYRSVTQWQNCAPCKGHNICCNSRCSLSAWPRLPTQTCVSHRTRVWHACPCVHCCCSGGQLTACRVASALCGSQPRPHMGVAAPSPCEGNRVHVWAWLSTTEGRSTRPHMDTLIGSSITL